MALLKFFSREKGGNGGKLAAENKHKVKAYRVLLLAHVQVGIT